MIERDELDAIENAVLSGLRKANSLGSGETGAQPGESTGLPSPNAPVLLKGSPLNDLLDAVSESDWRRAYDLGPAAEQELYALRALFFEYVGTDFAEVIARRNP